MEASSQEEINRQTQELVQSTLKKLEVEILRLNVKNYSLTFLVLACTNMAKTEGRGWSLFWTNLKNDHCDKQLRPFLSRRFD